MKGKVGSTCKFCAASVAPLTLIGALLLAAWPTPMRADSGQPRVLPPEANPFGKSYVQWSEEHWRWLFAIPGENHPAFQDGNVDISAYQPPGRVWFLIGSFSATPVANGFSAVANRTGVIPSGTALFFPIIDAEASTAEGNGTTRAELLAAARSFLDPVSGLACEVDGQAVPDLARYRFETPVFTWGPVPGDNLLGLSAGTSAPSVSAGYFVMLAPLPVGQHTIHFAGNSGVSPNEFMLDITYHLLVVPGPEDEEN